MIGVIGAYGAVGLSVARSLAATGHPLRIGGRDPVRLAAAADQILEDRRAYSTDDPPRSAVEPVCVDVRDGRRLAAFAEGCRVVVNCVGPSAVIGTVVARAAAAAGSAYVDVGGDAALAAALSATFTGARRRPAHARPAPSPPLDAPPAVVGAGISPGLTGLLPRWLATRLPEPPTLLRAWCGGLQEFTPAAAVDMVASLHDGYGVALAAWRDGAVVRHASAARSDVVLPPFPGRVAVLPYLSAETQGVADRLGLAAVEWFNVFAGRRTLAVLHEAARPDATLHKAARPEAASPAARTPHARLIDAAAADAAGLRPYQLLVFELSGPTHVRTLVVRGADGYRLTAATAVAAVHAVLAGAVPAGAHLAADVLDPGPVVAALRRGDGMVHVSDAPADVVEEGAI